MTMATISKPCAREGCDELVVKGRRSMADFHKRRFHTRSCAHAPGGQVRAGNPNGNAGWYPSVSVREIAAALPPAPRWRPEGWPDQPLTYPGARR